MTDAQGYGTCDLVLTSVPGLYFFSVSIGDFAITRNIRLNVNPGPACTFSLSPANVNAGAPGMTGAVGVTTQTNCGWTATSNANWITVTTGASGTGNGTVAYSVSPNAGVPRAGTITIGGQTFTVNQAAPGSGGALTITTGAALPAGISGTAYSASIGANGGTPPYSFSATGIPAGLAVNPTTGAITGTAGPVGSYTFTVTVKDNAGQSQTQTVTLTVVSNSPGANPSITNTSFPNGTIGTAYSQNLTAVGGCLSPFSAPPVFTLAGGSLPAGLSIVASPSGITTIAGTPTANGTSTFTLKVTDNCGRSGTANLSLTIGTGGGPGPGPGPGPVGLAASPNQLQFSVQSGTAAVSQPISLTANVAAQYSVQIQYNSGAPLTWLTVTPIGGSVPATLNVTATPGLLPAGTYTAQILLSAGTTTTGVTVPVTLRVLAPPAPLILPSSLTYVYQQGTPPSGAQTLNVGSTGGQFDFTVTTTTESGGSWLAATPLVGSTPGLVTVTVNPIGMPTGTYKGVVKVAPVITGVDPISIPVTLSIPQNAPVVTAVVNAASFALGPISPGEFVTIFGSAMGPATLTQGSKTSEGRLETVVAETQVLFDNIPAPVIYTSANQISAIVPYGVYGRATTRVEVEYRGAHSVGFELRVADSAPGIFTVSPQGQAAAINEDGTINSSSNGANPGSIVAIYMTGEGQTDPGGVDGRFASTLLPKPLLPVTAQIAGQAADILYYGAAPELPAGMMQVNVRLPDDLPHGTAVPVVIFAGRAASQSGVTIFVK